MPRTEATLNTITFSNNYDLAHHIWTDEEHAALGDYKSTAEVIKNRLESNGIKIQEMYVIEHKGEKNRNTQASIDTTKLHYHVVLKFAPGGGATLRELAKYMGILPQNIEIPERGRYSYPDMLSYLTHIKYPDKLQYPPENVVTLAGKDYMDYYNAHAESWIKARGKVGEKKPKKRRLREAIAKMEKGEIAHEELHNIPQYRDLLFDPKYARQLENSSECVKKVAKKDYEDLAKMIENREITYFDEIITNKRWKLACKHHKDDLEQKIGIRDYSDLKQKIEHYEITFDEIITSKRWEFACKYHKERIEREIGRRDYSDLRKMIENKEITFDEIITNKRWELACKYHKDEIEREIAESYYPELKQQIRGNKITSEDELNANENLKVIYKHKASFLLNDFAHAREIWG